MTTNPEPMPFDELRAWIAASWEERYITVTVSASDPEYDEDEDLVSQPFEFVIEAREIQQHGDQDGSGLVESVVHGVGGSLDEAAARVLATAVRP